MASNNGFKAPNKTTTSNVVYSTSSSSQAARIGFKICKRPDDGGSSGRKTAISANFFPIEIDFSRSFYQYAVEIECIFEKRDGTTGKFSVLRDSRQSYLNKILDGQLDPNTYVFNGDAILYSTNEIGGKKEIMYSKKLPSEAHEGKSDEYVATIKFACQIHYHNLEEYLRNPSSTYPQPEIALIDLVYRHNKMASHVYNGRCLYNLNRHEDKIDLDKTGLFICTGHYQSLRPTLNGWRFNVDLKSTVFHYECSVGDFLMGYCNLNPEKSLSEDQMRKIGAALKGIFVTVPHLKNHKKYRVQGLSKPANEEIFVQNEGTPQERRISIAQYFKETHFELCYPNLPCIVTAKTPRLIAYPIEACEIPPGQSFLKTLPQKLQSIMVKETAYKPDEHKKRIDLVATERHKDVKLLENFGIREVQRKEMASCQARILDPINVFCNQVIRTRDGQWRMQNHHEFKQPAEMASWLIVWQCKDERKDDKYNDMVRLKLRQGLVETMKSNGIKMSEPIMQNLSKFSVEEIFNLIRQKMKRTPDLVVFIINDLDDVYEQIKSIAELKMGVVTQCMRFDKLVSQMDFRVSADRVAEDRRLSSYLDNVCKKINAKIGGTNTTVEFKNLSGVALNAEPVMFFGADVATVASKGKSYAAVVGSYDLNFCKYAVRVSEQVNLNENKASQEIILNMEEMATSLLKKFEEKNKQLPKRIVFYRDGVDSGQFQGILDQEMFALKKACAKFNKEIKITMVVVVKRHHTKLYPTKQDDMIKSGNLLPGTVVDTNIVNPHHFDFYLNSHQAGLGTARPTYYWVIYDENKFSSDDMQKLTFNLCHLYASCTKSVSLPSPVYYAHLAAYRGITYADHLDLAQNMAELSVEDMQDTKTRLIEINPTLEEKMFFI